MKSCEILSPNLIPSMKQSLHSLNSTRSLKSKQKNLNIQQTKMELRKIKLEMKRKQKHCQLRRKAIIRS